MSVQLIAEIGQAHDGSLGTLYAYIDKVAESGVDSIKFQTHYANAESSIHEPFRVKFSRQDHTRFDYWKRMEFSPDQWIEIGNYCKLKGLKFGSSPFSNYAVDVLERADVDFYKIGSGEITNLLLLDKVSKLGKPVIISSGMSSWEELDKAYSLLSKQDVDVAVLQCTTAYPTEPYQYGLNVIGQMNQRYDCPIGFSDHSGDIAAGLAAVALGAEILEFHVVFDKAMFGPDTQSSLDFVQLSSMVAGVRLLERALANPVDKDNIEKFEDLKSIFEKSLAVNKDLKRGHLIEFDDLEAKKPKGYGLSANLFEKVIGKRLVVDKDQWDFLNLEDFE